MTNIQKLNVLKTEEKRRVGYKKTVLNHRKRITIPFETQTSE